MKFIQKPSPPFEAFQWFKLGDGPVGVVEYKSSPAIGVTRYCIYLSRTQSVEVNPGDWIAEIAPGKWKCFTPAAFEDFCIPVLVLEGLKAKNPI